MPKGGEERSPFRLDWWIRARGEGDIGQCSSSPSIANSRDWRHGGGALATPENPAAKEQGMEGGGNCNNPLDENIRKEWNKINECGMNEWI